MISFFNQVDYVVKNIFTTCMEEMELSITSLLRLNRKALLYKKQNFYKRIRTVIKSYYSDTSVKSNFIQQRVIW